MYQYESQISSLPLKFVEDVSSGILNNVNIYANVVDKEQSGSIASTETNTSVKYKKNTTLETPEMPGLLTEKKSRPVRLLLGSFKGTSTSNTSTGKYGVGTGDWKEGTFCHQFLVNTFQLPIPVCGNTTSRSSVKCFGSPYSNQMSTCILENVVISPRLLAKAMRDADKTKFKQSEPSIALLGGRGTECNNLSLDKLRHHMESGDYVWQVINKVKQEPLQTASVCERWIDDDVFLFTAHRFHIYFRFLDYFNVHKLLEDFNHTLSRRYHIIRMSGSDDYHFSQFDQSLFPEVEVQALDRLDDIRTCFRKVILVPKSYASVLFQCKMPISVKHKCEGCNGHGLIKTQIMSFRERVLKACFVSDLRSNGVTNANANSVTNACNSSITFVSRQAYLRNKNDKIANFERVMDNEDKLLLGLKEKFNASVVQRVHLEDLKLCEQIRIVHDSDIFLAVHGAGLVHLWWLKDDSLVVELEPDYEIGNPTFHTLALLSGHKYMRFHIRGGWEFVHANVGGILKGLDKYSVC